MTTLSPAPAQRQLWLAALKPPMYSVAVIPIGVGTAVAGATRGEIDWRIGLTFLLSAILIIAWLNLSNDVFDADTGIDRHKLHSVVNLTGNQGLIFGLANGCLLLGILGILAIAWWQQDPMVLGIVLLCCFLGYTYQGPPFRFGYQGWGEIICFVCFGPLAVSAAYYSQTGSWSMIALAVAVIVGLTTSIILFCSHFHQVEDDLAAGKRSPIVRLGTARGAEVLGWLCLSVFVLTLLFWALGWFPLGTLLVFLSAWFAIQLVRRVSQFHDQPLQVSQSKFIAVGLHFWSGVLLGAGFLIG
jgi:2-carboxy-1,4-naphthoquinone phytyltransferase